MTFDKAPQRAFAAYLLKENRMVVEASADMMKLFPLGIQADDTVAWLKAVKNLLGDAVELRQPLTPAGEWKLAVKDRAILFNYTQTRTLENMAEDRKTNA